MRLIQTIISEIGKNFKIIFRSWTSLFLLIIGPLLLILLLGWAYSGTTLHDVRFGVVSNEFNELGFILNDFYQFGQVYHYASEDHCEYDLRLERVHVCLIFSENFVGYSDSGQPIPSGSVVFKLDNSRKKSSGLILSALETGFGIAADEVSVKSTEALLSNVQQMIVFIGEKRQDIDKVENEALDIRSALVERKQTLVNFRTDFLPKYDQLKLLQQKINSESQFENNINSGVTSIDDARSFVSNVNGLIDSTVSDLYLLSSQINSQTYYVFSGYDSLGSPIYTPNYIDATPINSIIYQLNSLKPELSSLNQELYSLRSQLLMTKTDYYALQNQFNTIMADVEFVKTLLDLEIDNTQKYIGKIDVGLQNLRKISSKLDKDLTSFSGISPDAAQSLVNPITYSFEETLDAKNIAIIFSTLLVGVIIFISMLFSNIVTLSEINSRAFFRSLITPVRPFLFTFGLIFTNVVIVLFQVSVLLLVAQFSFGVNVFGNLGTVFIIAFSLIVVFVFFGMTIAYLFPNQQTSILITTLLALAYFLFSNAIAPLEIMPLAASSLAALNPMVIGESMFRKVFLFGFGYDYLGAQLFQMLLYIILGFIVLSITIRVYKRRI
ncbi:ABC transporter permease [Candidatus Woesearchaeota archaeon]|nr:ABC transporter permease [Candidatus Woesearchaeota archaeon]